jgi:hypothetical protein
MTWYGGKRYKTVSFVIPISTALSQGIDLRGGRLVGFALPVMTSTALRFDVSSDDGGSYLNAYDSANALVSYTIASSRYYILAEDDARGLRGFVRLNVGSNEAAARTVIGVVDDGD